MRWGAYLENLCVSIILCAADFQTVSINRRGGSFNFSVRMYACMCMCLVSNTTPKKSC